MTDPLILQRVGALTREGRSAKEIARVVGRTERQVVRYRKRLGLVQDHPGVYPASYRQTAAQMLQEGCSYTEIARTLGVSSTAVADWFPGRGWTKRQSVIFGNQVTELKREVGLR